MARARISGLSIASPSMWLQPRHRTPRTIPVAWQWSMCLLLGFEKPRWHISHCFVAHRLRTSARGSLYTPALVRTLVHSRHSDRRPPFLLGSRQKSAASFLAPQSLQTFSLTVTSKRTSVFRDRKHSLHSDCSPLEFWLLRQNASLGSICSHRTQRPDGAGSRRGRALAIALRQSLHAGCRVLRHGLNSSIGLS